MSKNRLSNSIWGVFNHYLWSSQNDPASPKNQGAGETSWDECVNALDVELVARTLHECGARFYFFTLMQGTRYMAAPNETYDRIAGTKPGEACAKRDVVADLHEALSKYGIDLYLYYTGDGPYKDPEIGPKFGFTEPRSAGVTMSFVQKWAAVLEEYAVRYGNKVKGWWIDGCYRGHFKYDDILMAPYYEACHKGNPDCVVAMNDGVKPIFFKNYAKEDFVCGEFNDFTVLPPSRFIDGAQSFILAPLGVPPDGCEWNGWGKSGVKRSGEYLRNFISCAHETGCAVAIDIYVNRDGSFDPAQVEALKQIRL